MRLETTETKEVKVSKYYCDNCGQEVNFNFMRHCHGCNKHLCRHCAKTMDNHNVYFCPDCKEIFERYEERLTKARQTVEKLTKKRTTECIEAKKKHNAGKLKL